MWFICLFLLGFPIEKGLAIEQKKFHVKSIFARPESLDLALVKTFPRIRSALVCAVMAQGLNKLATNFKDDQECIVYDETLIQETDGQTWSLVHLLNIPKPNYQYVSVDSKVKCPDWKFQRAGMVLEHTLELNQCVLIEGLKGTLENLSNANVHSYCVHQFWHPNDTKIQAKIVPQLFELQTADNCENGRMDFIGFRNPQEENDPENKSNDLDHFTLCSKISSPKLLEAFGNPRIEFLKYGGNMDGKGINFTVCAVAIA